MKHSIKSQIIAELSALFNDYPDFVRSKNNFIELDGIPVFVYHTIEPKLFESHLQYLRNNDYKTLSINEFYDFIANDNKPISYKVVLLTIDDARSSVWRYAYPLLKRYQMFATVFVIPGISQDQNEVRRNLDDFWQNKCNLNEIRKIDIRDETLCNWAEIRNMYNSGLINIESHTLFHREIFSEIKIVDFISPLDPLIPYSFKGSPYFSLQAMGGQINLEEFVGLPLFKSKPLMLGESKLNIAPEFIRKCREIFLNSKSDIRSWQDQIKKIVNDAENRKKYFSIETSSRNDVLEDLRLAREIIQKKLDNKAGNHLCLPWTTGNNETINICKELEIKSCFWGTLANKGINKPGDDPFFITRIKNDFIFRLPGRDRKSLFLIYNYKINRRLSGEKVF